MKQPKLIVVGAGPGDADLITMKGLKAVQNANAILYDALVNNELLDQAPKDIPIVFVGKRKGKHTFTQDQINELIVQQAKLHGTVIRLKGGDPFVFGRGFEEMEFAEKHGLATEYIPGISSAIGVPGLNGIPVTFRGGSESFWVITGTTSSRQISEDIHLAVNSTATIVVLMGLTKLPEIVEIYKNSGKPNKPIAIIQKGASPQEKMVVGTMATIVDLAQKQQISPPAIIVIGDVVKLAKTH
jgi:uroporphyrin-III C-methyltransferase